MAKKDLVIVANASQPLGKFHCDKCGNNVIATKEVIASCPFCGELFESEASKVKANVTASLSHGDGFGVFCEDCSAHLNVYNSPNDGVDFSLSRFCPVCGGCNLLAEDEDASITLNKSSDVNETQIDVKEENDESRVDPEIIENKEQAILDTQKDVQEALDGAGTGDSITEESIQWKSVDDAKNGKDGTLVAFSASTGNPLFIFRRSDCSKDLQPIFATSVMIDAFNQVARKDGIGTAVKKFGGKAYPVKEVMKSNYLDSLVDAKINTEIMPKFIECMALAVDGAIKGVYSDLREEINASLANDLIGAGLPRERVETAITSTLGSGGTTVFASILAKAMDLMGKSSVAYQEAKSMITSASLPRSEMDIEQSRVRAALNASTQNNIVLGSSSFVDTTPAFNNDVDKLRKRLKFSIKL